LIANLGTMPPQLNITVSEIANCTYRKTVNNVDEGETLLGENNIFLSGLINFTDNQVFDLNVSCIDLVGYPAVEKHISLVVNSSAVVTIYNITPSGYSNQRRPTLRANTFTRAICTAEVTNMQQPWWLDILDFVTFNTEPKPMQRSSDAKSHYIDVFSVAGPELEEGQSYGFRITCVDDEPNADLISSSQEFAFTTDFTPPILNVQSPYPYTKEITANTIDVSGSVDELSTIRFIKNGADIAAPITGNTFATTLQLGAGLNVINVTATDAAGNMDYETLRIRSTGPQPCILVDGKDGDCVPT
jgi:hypothetical protein